MKSMPTRSPKPASIDARNFHLLTATPPKITS
jgi:hypothetical protein